MSDDEGQEAPYANTSVGCSLCPERMRFERYVGRAQPPFPKGWRLDMVHDHSADTPGYDPQWVAVVYYREPKGRFPQPAKYVREQQAQNRRDATVVKQVKNASSGKRSRMGG